MSTTVEAEGACGLTIGDPIEGVALLTSPPLGPPLANETEEAPVLRYSALSGRFGQWPLGFRLIQPTNGAGAAAADEQGEGCTLSPYTLTPTLCPIEDPPPECEGYAWRWDVRSSGGVIECSAFGDDPFQPPKGAVWRAVVHVDRESQVLARVPETGFQFELSPEGEAHTAALKFDCLILSRPRWTFVRMDGLPIIPASKFDKLKRALRRWQHYPATLTIHHAMTADREHTLGHGFVEVWNPQLHREWLDKKHFLSTSSIYFNGVPSWKLRIHRRFPHLARAVVATVHLCNHRGALPAECGARLPRLPAELLWEILERFTVFDMMPRSVLDPAPSLAT